MAKRKADATKEKEETNVKKSDITLAAEADQKSAWMRAVRQKYKSLVATVDTAIKSAMLRADDEAVRNKMSEMLNASCQLLQSFPTSAVDRAVCYLTCAYDGIEEGKHGWVGWWYQTNATRQTENWLELEVKNINKDINDSSIDLVRPTFGRTTKSHFDRLNWSGHTTAPKGTLWVTKVEVLGSIKEITPTLADYEWIRDNDETNEVDDHKYDFCFALSGNDDTSEDDDRGESAAAAVAHADPISPKETSCAQGIATKASYIA